METSLFFHLCSPQNMSQSDREVRCIASNKNFFCTPDGSFRCFYPYTHFFLHTGYGYLRFCPGIENLILPMLSYPGCHLSAKYIGCIGTHAHGRQVTSLLCQSDVIITCRISGYSGTSGSLFLRIKCVI